MRLAGLIFLASAVALLTPTLIGWLPQAAQAESGVKSAKAAKGNPSPKKAAPKAAAKKAAPKQSASKQAAPKQKQAAPKEASPALPLAERIGIQYDLAWAGHFNGLISGAINEQTTAAIKAFQKDSGAKETGVLAAPERTRLAAVSKAVQERVGWTMVDDKATGAQLGLPVKQLPNTTKAGSGTRWSSAQGQVQIETFRIREPGTTLAAVFEQQKRQPPNRRPNVNLLRDDFFILSGLQGLKKFYVRAHIRDLEVRGITILYDQATEGIMDPVTVVMSSAFAPFAGTGLTDLMGPTRRKIEYGSGIVATANGHILTDRLLVEGCSVIQVSGLGDATVVAENDTGIALLRVFGVSDLMPAALVHDGAKGPDLTLIGIADPQLQAGGRAVSTATARLNGEAIQPPPQPGFAGAAVLDQQGRLLGMVTLKTPQFAGTAAPPTATAVAVGAIRRFLDDHYVTPATGRTGVEAAKAALVRVICVRR